jgi:hypothetical protein
VPRRYIKPHLAVRTASPDFLRLRLEVQRPLVVDFRPKRKWVKPAVLRSEPRRRMILLREINSVTVIFMIMCEMRRIFTHLREKGAYTASPVKSVLSPESSGNNVLARTLVNGDRQRLFDCPVRVGQWNVTNQRSVKTFVYIILASEVSASLLLVHAFVLLLIPILPK